MNFYKVFFLLFIGFIVTFEPILAAELSSIDNVKRFIRYRDYLKAVDELNLLLEQNNPDAQFIMGGLYRLGKGVNKDSVKARYYYQQAAEAGLKDAQYALASILEKQSKSQKEKAIFIQWYEKSASNGHVQAIKKLKQLKTVTFYQGNKDDIYSAIRSNNIEKIYSYIEQKVSFNILDNKLRTPLQVALLSNHHEIAQLILPLTNVTQKNNDIDLLPLHLAVANNDIKIAERLLKQSVDINAIDSFGNTALFIATRRNDVKMVAMLLKNKADPVQLNKKQNSALMLAKTLNNKNIFKVYESFGYAALDKKAGKSKIDLNEFKQKIGVKKSIYGNWPLINIASLLGEQDIVLELLNKDIDPNKKDKEGFSALHRAASQGHVTIVKLLLKYGYYIDSINERGETALLIASRSGQIGVVNYLLSQHANADISSKNKSSALLSAIRSKNIILAQKLLLPTKNPSIIHQSLKLAIQQKMEPLSIKLYKKGRLNKEKDVNQRSLLWHSADKNLIVLSQFILEDKTIDINALDKRGYSALAQAVSKSNNKIAYLLLHNNADLQMKTADENSVLMLAVLAQNTDLIKFFMQNKSLIDLQNKLGNTALILAVIKGNLQQVKLLLTAGANTLLRNNHNFNAYQVANELDNDAIAKAIEGHGNNLFKIFK